MTELRLFLDAPGFDMSRTNRKCLRGSVFESIRTSERKSLDNLGTFLSKRGTIYAIGILFAPVFITVNPL
jgi:hypothetical protein